MGHKNHKGSVSITKYNGRIRLRWRYLKTRYSLNLFHYNKINLLKAKQIALEIENDIVNKSFDLTLNKYRDKEENNSLLTSAVQPSVNTSTTKEENGSVKTIIQYFEDWTRNYRQMDCEINVHYNALRNTMKKWGDFDEDNALSKLNQETFGAKTYNERLTMLKGFCKWLVKAKIWLFNPFEDVARKKVKKVSNATRKPFTDEEIKKILDAFKDDTYCPKSSRFTHSHYYPFIYFIFKTGVRPAEAIGLRVSNVDLVSKIITIKEAMARTLKGTNAAHRVRKETKNGKERLLPLTTDLHAILKPLIEERSKDDLVFKSITGLAIDDHNFQRRVFRPILKGLEIEERVLYACRHTFGSRCIDSGITPVMTAFLMGNNPETALRNYIHQINIPTDLPKI